MTRLFIYIYILYTVYCILLYSIGFRLQFVSPSLEACLFSTCSMFCSCHFLSFLACFVYLSYFPSSSRLLSFHFCFIFLQVPIMAIPVPFPFTFPFIYFSDFVHFLSLCLQSALPEKHRCRGKA